MNIRNKIMFKLYKYSIKGLEKIDKLSREYGLENSQEFINWQDSINSISVR